MAMMVPHCEPEMDVSCEKSFTIKQSYIENQHKCQPKYVRINVQNDVVRTNTTSIQRMPKLAKPSSVYIYI